MIKHARDDTSESGSSFVQRCYNLEDPEKLKLELDKQMLETHPLLAALFDPKRLKEPKDPSAKAAAKAVANEWNVELSTLYFYYLPCSRIFLEELKCLAPLAPRHSATRLLFEARSQRVKTSNKTTMSERWIPEDVKTVIKQLNGQDEVIRSGKRSKTAAKTLISPGQAFRTETPCPTSMASPASDEDSVILSASSRQKEAVTSPTTTDRISIPDSPPSSKDRNIFDEELDILNSTHDPRARIPADVINEAIKLMAAPYVSIRAVDSRWYNEAGSVRSPFNGPADYFSIAVQTEQRLLTSLHENGDDHWILALLDPSTGLVQLWDSLQNPGRRQRACKKLSRYFGGISWKFEDIGSAQQEDTIVCGIFVFIFACHLVTGIVLPEKIPPLAVSIWRRVLCHFIVNGKGSWALYDSPVAIRYEPERKSFTSIKEFLAAKKERETYEADLLREVRASASRYHDDLDLADTCLEQIANVLDSLSTAIKRTTVQKAPEQLERFKEAIGLANKKYGGEIKAIESGLISEIRQIHRRLECLGKLESNVGHIQEAIGDAKDVIARTRNDLEGLEQDTSDNQAALLLSIESQEPSPGAITKVDNILPKTDCLVPLDGDSTAASPHVATLSKLRGDSEESWCTTSPRISTMS